MTKPSYMWLVVAELGEAVLQVLVPEAHDAIHRVVTDARHLGSDVQREGKLYQLGGARLRLLTHDL